MIDQVPVSVVVNVMLEQWEAGVAPGLGPMGNPLPGGAIDHQALSWARYGPRTGAGKLLDLLAARSVPATFYISGILAEENPKLVATIAGDGHEIAAHGWAQNIVPAALDKRTEREQLRRCLTVLTDAAGQRPDGCHEVAVVGEREHELLPACLGRAERDVRLIGECAHRARWTLEGSAGRGA